MISATSAIMLVLLALVVGYAIWGRGRLLPCAELRGGYLVLNS